MLPHQIDGEDTVEQNTKQYLNVSLMSVPAVKQNGPLLSSLAWLEGLYWIHYFVS